MHYNPQIVTSDSSAGAALHRRLSAVCEVLCARDVLALDIDPRDCEGTLENRGGEVRVKYLRYGTHLFFFCRIRELETRTVAHVWVYRVRGKAVRMKVPRSAGAAAHARP